MNIDDKRTCLIAAYLRLEPAATSLRDRVLRRLVVVALAGSSYDDPYRIGKIRSNTAVSGPDSGLRTDIVEVVVKALIEVGLVDKTELLTRHAYFLTEKGEEELETVDESAAELFKPVLKWMLADLEGECDNALATSIVTRFIAYCFGVFGSHMASVSTGDATYGEILDGIDAEGAFDFATNGKDLGDTTSDSLRARCYKFLRSKEPHDVALKFRLTQGYYVAKLLGVEKGEFNPLTEDAFKGSVMYLDTNVLLTGFLTNDAKVRFREFIHAGVRAHIDFRVTSVTIDELNRVIERKTKELDVVSKNIPSELLERGKDGFLEAFLDAQEADEDITVEAFFRSLPDVPSFLQESDLVIEEWSAERLPDHYDILHVESVISDAAEKLRGRGKSKRVANHDAFHFILVDSARSKKQQAWFLTRDRTVLLAAKKLSEGDMLFAFPLNAFIQSVSPFVRTTEDDNAVVEMFTFALEQEMFGITETAWYSLSELRVIAEMHEDVLSTREEDVVMAFDYIKKIVLEGRAYHESDHPKVALELRKYFASSLDERKKFLDIEMERLRGERKSERRKRKAAESSMVSMTEGYAISRQNALAREQRITSKLDVKTGQLRRSSRREFYLSIGLMCAGLVVAFIGWHLDSPLATALGVPTLDWVVRSLASIVFVSSSIPVITRLSSVPMAALVTVFIVMAIIRADVLGNEWVASVGSYFDFTAPIAVIIAWYIANKSDKAGATEQRE